MLKIIAEKDTEDLAMQAKLHGMSVKPNIVSNGLSKEERKQVDDHGKAIFDRLKRQAEANKAIKK